MLKLTAIVSLVLIATWSQADTRRHKKDASDSSNFGSGSTMWAASLSCDSCGSECTSACGTRHFRSCCFNYLRRKRGPEGLKFLSSDLEINLKRNNIKAQPDVSKAYRPKLPVFVVENLPEPWMSSMIAGEYRPYPYEDTIENRLFDV